MDKLVSYLKNKKIIAAVVAVVAVSAALLLTEPQNLETSPIQSSSQAASQAVSEIDDNSSVPLSPKPEQEEKVISDRAENLNMAKATNKDAAAWLTLPNTQIDNAIMHTDNNSYYLTHTETHEYSVWGAYFADMMSDLSSPNKLEDNTVIYGHTGPSESPDAKAFTQMFAYNDIEHMKENPYMYLTIDDEKLIFEIFAVFYTDIDFYYIDPTPFDQDDFLEEVQKRSEYVFPDVKVTSEDKLLTLSGCSYKYDVNQTDNHRYAIMGKLVEEERDDIEVEVNTSPLRPKV